MLYGSYLWKWNLRASEVVLARTAKRIQYVDFRLLRLHLCYRRSYDPSFVSHPAKIQFGFLFISVSHIKRMRRKIEIKRAAAEAAIFFLLKETVIVDWGRDQQTSCCHIFLHENEKGGSFKDTIE